MDHISALPNDVVTRIFSFLPFKDVVKTSALSRPWRYTWTTTTPHLEFDGLWLPNHEPPYSGFPSFPSLVDKVLRQCASAPVTKFHITHFKYSDAYGPKLDLWLRFAKEHRVEDLRLRLANDPPFFYKPPRFLYRLSRLVRLEVSACCFWLGGATKISWPLLKVLSMEDVELSDDILGRILRGSPVLQSLTLARCRGVKNIVIDSSTSVKDLLLIGGSFSELEKIWAPDLLSLCVSGTWYPPKGRRGISLDDVSSLVEAKLDFAILYGWPGYLKELLEKLREVPTITIGGWCLQIMSQLVMEGVPSPLSKCQNLILEAPVSELNLSGIACMLQSSQCLEKLVIHLTNLPRSKVQPELDEESDEESDEEFEDRVNFDGEELLCLQKGNLGCLAAHLKRIEISSTGADRYVLALLKFLLSDALVLEKLVINELVIEVKVPTHFVPRKLLGAKKNVLRF